MADILPCVLPGCQNHPSVRRFPSRREPGSSVPGVAMARISATVLLVAALAGCAGTGGPAPSPSGSVVSPADSASAVGHPRLDLDDDGAAVPLRVGREASITLVDRRYEWGEPRVAGDAVSVSEFVHDAPAPGRMWSVVAKRPGTAKVTIAGSPTCRSATPPCAAPDRLWTVRFDVTP